MVASSRAPKEATLSGRSLHADKIPALWPGVAEAGPRRSARTKAAGPAGAMAHAWDHGRAVKGLRGREVF